MTQNKHFKRRVRARMAETGETYVQARRALHDGRAKSVTLRAIGFWKSLEEPQFPDPIDFVDASWDPQERQRVLRHLRDAHELEHLLGFAECRLGCGQEAQNPKRFFQAEGTTDEEKSWTERHAFRHLAVQKTEDAGEPEQPFDPAEMGCAELTDGVYMWPEGLVHYLEKHNVRLPQEFVDHVLKQPELRGQTKTFVLLDDANSGFQERHGPDYTVDHKWWCGYHSVLTKTELLARTMWSGKLLHRLQVESPFPAGWYYNYAEYPEEGSVGPYKTRKDAESASLMAHEDGQKDYKETFRKWMDEEITVHEAMKIVDGTTEVEFWEQKEQATVIQQYVAEQMRETIESLKNDPEKLRDALVERLSGLLEEARLRSSKEGTKTPGSEDVEILALEPTEQDLINRVIRVQVHIKSPEKYPQFVRDLVDEGILKPQHRVSLKIEEGA